MRRRTTGALVGTAALVAALLPTAGVSAATVPTRSKTAPLLLHGATSAMGLAPAKAAPQLVRPRASIAAVPTFTATSAVLVGTGAERNAITPTPFGLYVGAYTDTAPTGLEVDGHEHDGPAATADSTAVVYSRAATAGAFQLDYDLYRLPFATPGSPVRLTDTAGAELDAEPSPDLAYVVYTHYDLDPVNGLVSPSLCVIPAAGAIGTTPTCLAGFSHGTWRDSTTLIASDDRTATSPLVTIPVASGVLGTPVAFTDPAVFTTGAFDGAFDPSVSQSGLYLAYVDGQGRPSILVFGTSFGDQSTGMSPAGAAWFAPHWVGSELPAFAGSDAAFNTLPATIPFAGPTDSPDAAEVSGIPATDTVAPSITGLSASAVKPGTTVTIAANDGHATRSPIALTCVLDTRAPVDCTSGFPTTGVSDARHTLHVTARDVAGNTSTADLPLATDGTPPSVPVVTLPLFTLGRTATAKFVSTDATSGISDYRLSLSGNSFGAPGGFGWSGFFGSSATGTYPLKFNGAENSCVQVRAVDKAGNASAYSAKTCITTPLDDRNMQLTTSGWVKAKGSKNYLGTTTVTKKVGARMQSYNPVGMKQVIIYGTACSTCGSVGVWSNGTRIGTVSFASKTYVASKAIKLVLPKYRFGRIALTNLSTKAVVVDALVVIAK